MGAELSLKFEDSAVTLSMVMDMEIAKPPTADLELPSGTVFIFAGNPPLKWISHHAMRLLSPSMLSHSVNCQHFCTETERREREA